MVRIQWSYWWVATAGIEELLAPSLGRRSLLPGERTLRLQLLQTEKFASTAGMEEDVVDESGQERPAAAADIDERLSKVPEWRQKEPVVERGYAEVAPNVGGGQPQWAGLLKKKLMISPGRTSLMIRLARRALEE